MDIRVEKRGRPTIKSTFKNFMQYGERGLTKRELEILHDGPDGGYLFINTPKIAKEIAKETRRKLGGLKIKVYCAPKANNLTKKK